MRVIVAGRLPREPHNAALHLFSASPELVEYGSSAYERRSPDTGNLLGQILAMMQAEGFAMPYTMADFRRDYVKRYFPELTPEEQEEVLRAIPVEQRLAGLPPEERLAGLSPEQIQQYLAQLAAGHPTRPQKRRRKK